MNNVKCRLAHGVHCMLSIRVLGQTLVLHTCTRADAGATYMYMY